MRKDEYLIMDGRAIFDMDRAGVLEACGTTCPTRKYVERAWPADSVIVRLTDWDGKAICKGEIVWDR